MTEYIIVVALIAIAAIGVVTVFGGNVRSLFGAAATSLAGDTNVQVRTQKPNEATYSKVTLRDAFQQK